MKKIKFIDLFCGIGGFRIAAEKAFSENGFSSDCVFSSDIDPFVQESYFFNFGHHPTGDIKQIVEDEIPDHDILFGGFPCQPFSIIGKGDGFNDIRGTLFFEIVRILNKKRPKAFVLENVKQIVSHQKGETMQKIINTLRHLGYFVDWKVLNALDYGLPQKRERVFIVGYDRSIDYVWPEKTKTIPSLTKVLQKQVERKYYASEYIIKKRKKAHRTTIIPSIWHENKSGNISSYPYSCALRAGASYNYLLVNGERRLTPREMLRLQGFPDSFKIMVPDAQIRKQAGNAVPVNLVAAVLNCLMPFFSKDFKDSSKVSAMKEVRNARREVATFAQCR